MTTTHEDIVAEAERRCRAETSPMLSIPRARVAIRALELAASGWTKPEPVDPDLIEARKLVAATHSNYRDDILAGGWDLETAIILARVGIKRGRELANSERPPAPLVAVEILRRDYHNAHTLSGPIRVSPPAFGKILDYFAALEAGAK